MLTGKSHLHCAHQECARLLPRSVPMADPSELSDESMIREHARQRPARWSGWGSGGFRSVRNYLGHGEQRWEMTGVVAVIL